MTNTNTITITRSNITFEINTTPDFYGTLRVVATNDTETEHGEMRQFTTGGWIPMIAFDFCDKQQWLIAAADERSKSVGDYDDEESLAAKPFDRCNFNLTDAEVAAITESVNRQASEIAESKNDSPITSKINTAEPALTISPDVSTFTGLDFSSTNEKTWEYEPSAQAVRMLDRMSETEYAEWNAREMKKIEMDDEARHRANNRRRGIPNDGPTYENGFQEWDD